MSFVRSHDTEIYYESQGDGPAILFAHGGGGNAASWFAQVAHFRTTHRCIAFDHRGFGRSRWRAERFEPDLYADDARAVLDVLGVERAHVVAQSLGALTAVRLALQSPERVRSLVLSSSPLGIADPPAIQGVVEGAIRIAKLGAEGVLETFAPASRGDARRMELYAAIASFNLDLRPELAPTILAPEILLPVEELKRIACPVLCVTGRYDSLVPPAVMHRFASLIPEAECVEFEASGHSPYFEEPEAFNAMLARFLQVASGPR
ncbi:MAG: alpha/beta hydrolase [Myxococcota bacterium]|nr:alpha/beta hydrolase [Myxococcota bacterium]